MQEFGDATLDLVERVMANGVSHSVVLMRHSAREFAAGRHDLENPLTDDGRARARHVGERLPKALTVRAYASPAERCMETAALILEGHAANGGPVTRHRPLEALGVFYALDQMKMWKAMRDAGGLVPFVDRWIHGGGPGDAMIPAKQAARLLVGVLAAKLRQPVADTQADLCVTHDMTIYLLRDVLLGEPANGPEVAFLDALLLYERDGALWMRSHHGKPRRLD